MKKITIEEDGCPKRVITIDTVTYGGKVPMAFEDRVFRADLALVETSPIGEKSNKRKCKIMKDRYRPFEGKEVPLASARNNIVFTDSKASAKYQQYKNILILQKYV